MGGVPGLDELWILASVSSTAVAGGRANRNQTSIRRTMSPGNFSDVLRSAKDTSCRRRCHDVGVWKTFGPSRLGPQERELHPDVLLLFDMPAGPT